MSKDVVVAPPGKGEHPEHHSFGAGAGTGTSAGCRDDSDAAENGCLQLLPIEELVPLSQTLISPALARLLNTQPPPSLPAHGSCPQSVAQEFFRSDHVELRNMQKLAENDRIRIIGDGDHLKHSAEDRCRIHIPHANGPLIFQEGNGDLTGTGGSCKRSRLSAGLLDSYGMQLSDGDGPDDQGEGYGMSQLVDRDNSSNSGDGGAGSGGGGTASSGARTLKRPRLVWTPQLHKRFVDAVSHLGIKNAVPKTIMQLMNVEGLTRENVASHLQKYRLYLRRVQQGNLFSNCGNSPTRSTLGPGLDHGHHHTLIGSPATGSSDHLFSSSEFPLASSDHHQQTRSLHLLSGSINHLVHQHMPGALLQPAVSQHQLNQAMAVVKSPPLFNIAAHLDPRHYTANMISPSPVQKTAWPSLYTSTIDINASHRMENHGTPAGPPSPPQQALTLFPH